MEYSLLVEKIEKILSKPIYKFHSFDKDKMLIYANVEATPEIAYYHRREKIDIMNDLFEEEIKYVFNKDKGEINIEELIS